MSECSICGLEMQCCRTVAMKDLIEQRDQANRTCSDALSSAERAETEAGDLRKQLADTQRGLQTLSDALVKADGDFVDEQRAHAETRDALQRAEERSSLNFREYERASKELDLEQSAHAETLTALEQANQNFIDQHRDAVVPLMNELAETRARLEEAEGCGFFARSPAEQAVLDAMAACTDEQLRLMASGAWCGHGQDAALAELALREAAK